MKRRRFASALVGLGIWNGATTSAGARVSDSSDMATAQDVTVDLDFAGLQRGKPPSTSLLFDAVFRNPGSSPRWVILPLLLPATTGGGVDVIQTYEYRGAGGRVIVGRFLGTGGFQALHLPAHAEIAFSQFGIKYWGDPEAAPIQIDVIVATSILVDVTPADDLLGVPALSDPHAAVAVQSGELVHVTRLPDNRERPVHFGVDRRFSLSCTVR